MHSWQVNTHTQAQAQDVWLLQLYENVEKMEAFEVVDLKLFLALFVTLTGTLI